VARGLRGILIDKQTRFHYGIGDKKVKLINVHPSYYIIGAGIIIGVFAYVIGILLKHV
jgi:hypothetical protein